MRAVGKFAAILAVLLPLGFCAELDPAALLNDARARILENIEKLPKYTCVQTVRRYRYEAIPDVRANGCGDLADGHHVSRLLAWTDQLRLDVTVSGGLEIFSWAGARSFKSGDVEGIVGGGMTGTGDFGPFLSSIFSPRALEYRYLGTEQVRGRTCAVFSYAVPLGASHYEVVVGPGRKDTAVMAYRGQFWIDVETADISRM